MFNSGWATGLSTFSDFTNSLQKIKADLEQNIEAGLHHDQRQRTATAQAGMLPANPPEQGGGEAGSQAGETVPAETSATEAVDPPATTSAPDSLDTAAASSAAGPDVSELALSSAEAPAQAASLASDTPHTADQSMEQQPEHERPDSPQSKAVEDQHLLANGHLEPTQQQQGAASAPEAVPQSTQNEEDTTMEELREPDILGRLLPPAAQQGLTAQTDAVPDPPTEAAPPHENGDVSAAAHPEDSAGDLRGAASEHAGSTLQVSELAQPETDPPPDPQPSEPHPSASEPQQSAPDSAVTGTAAAVSQPAGSDPQHPEPSGGLQAQVQGLQQMLAAREAQLEAKAAEQARLQDVVTQLMERNEELAKRQARVSEGDMDTMRAEFQDRLSAAERRAYALQKERDSAKRAAEKATSLQDVIRERDVTIQQFAKEGEELSKKQLALESSAKKLRAQQKEGDLARKDLETKLLMEQQKAEGALTAQKRAEVDAAAAAKAHESTLASEKEHYSGLLQRSRAAQAEAEKKAADAAKEGLHRKLAEAEARVSSMLDTVEDLRAGLAQQQQEAGAREDAFSREVGELQQRCQDAEARHEQLAAALPSATTPLLRQLEAMQRSAQQHAAAWAATEAALSQRVTDADAAAAAAGERERLAGERLRAANSRAASSMAALQAVQSEVADSAHSCQAEYRLRMDAEARAQRLEAQLAQAQDLAMQATQQHQEALQAAESAWEDRRSSLLAAQLAAELRATDAEERLAGQEGASSLDGPGDPSGEPSGAREHPPSQHPPPPAMAAPGYRWVLQKEGEPPLQRQGLRSAWAGGTAGEVEQLRAELRQRGDQLEGLRAEIMGLEATRNDLAEELLAASRQVEAGRQQEQALQRMERLYQQLQQQLSVAVEMVGERDERVSELADQIADMRLVYQQQTEELISQLQAAKSAPSSPA